MVRDAVVGRDHFAQPSVEAYRQGPGRVAVLLEDRLTRIIAPVIVIEAWVAA
jgi:hypothetical protein